MTSIILWTLLAIDIVLVIMALVKVLLEELQPFKAMFWVMTIIFVPILGLVLFFFFGKNLHKKRLLSDRTRMLIAERTYQGFTAQADLVIPTRHERVINFFARLTLAFPFKNNRIEILSEGSDFFLHLLHDIGQAQSHIHLITYIFTDDALGRLVADALIDKAREGVEVRVIYDDVGSWETSNRFFERLRAAGVDVVSFMPVRFPAFTGKVNYRNHRKICVVDGKVGYIGGMNLALRYAKGGRGRDWCDTHLRVCGAVVSSLQRSFIDDWYLVDHSILRDDKYYPAPTVEPNDCLAQVVLSSPLLPWNGLMQGYVSLIYEARKYVYIETPYFIPPQPVLMALTTKALAGVDVCVMLPEHADRWFVEHAARSYIDRAHDAGVKFYLYQPGINHSKLLIIDDMVCSCGSTNIDFRSFENNCESNLFIYDTEMALRMKHLFLGDLAHCSPIDENYLFQHHTIHQRLADGVVRMFSPLM